MKRLFLLIAFAMCISICEVSAQQRVQLDSIAMKQLQDIHTSVKIATPRYKMYPTENFHILLKLDTATGKVWMVQFSLSDTNSMVVPIDNTSLLYSWEEEVAGRYELYPTQNMFNFILLDTYRGWTYQVQWSTKPENRFRFEIY